MRLYECNVGYGDAFLFVDDKGVCLLDTGSGLDSEYSSNRQRIHIVQLLNSLGIKKIDHLIISHIHEDHVGGLKRLLGKVEIEELWLPFEPEALEPDLPEIEFNELDKKSLPLFFSALKEYVGMVDEFGNKNAKIHHLKDGDEVDILGMKIKVCGAQAKYIGRFIELYKSLFTADTREEYIAVLTKLDALSNATSLLLYMEYRNFKALFCGDNVPGNWEASEGLFYLLKNVNVLKLPHHGQIDSVNEELMRKMPLRYCITTASSDLRYNCANTKVYESFQAWADEDGRQIRFLFNDFIPGHPYCQLPERYSYIVFDLECFGEDQVGEFCCMEIERSAIN